MTDTLTCPFCDEIAKFQRILSLHAQQFQCTVCHKAFAVNSADVAAEPRTQIYDMPTTPYEEAKKMMKNVKKR